MTLKLTLIRWWQLASILLTESIHHNDYKSLPNQWHSGDIFSPVTTFGLGRNRSPADQWSTHTHTIFPPVPPRLPRHGRCHSRCVDYRLGENAGGNFSVDPSCQESLYRGCFCFEGWWIQSVSQGWRVSTHASGSARWWWWWWRRAIIHKRAERRGAASSLFLSPYCETVFLRQLAFQSLLVSHLPHNGSHASRATVVSHSSTLRSSTFPSPAPKFKTLPVSSPLCLPTTCNLP